MKHIWFRRKQYGWGWYPKTWEGWLILLIYMTFFCSAEVLFMYYMARGPSLLLAEIFISYVIVLNVILITLCYRYGETPRWQWGISQKRSKKK